MSGNILVALGIFVFVIIDIIICLLINYVPKMIRERAKEKRIQKNMIDMKVDEFLAKKGEKNKNWKSKIIKRK
ncbi:MAG: hypothetical protein ACTSQR_08555 [Promethearchaeota archaeon]